MEFFRQYFQGLWKIDLECDQQDLNQKIKPVLEVLE